MSQFSSEKLQELIDKIKKFSDDRDWEQFHTPRNLATSLAIEAAEVLEIYQWDDENTHEVSDDEHEKLEEELADVLIYLLELADVAEIDLVDAAHKKIAINDKKYPIDKAKGIAQKYTELN